MELQHLIFGFFRILCTGSSWIFSRLRNVRLKEENCNSVVDKIVIVTGANSGSGKALAELLAARGATVIMACRNLINAKKAAEEIQSKNPKAKLDILRLDLEDYESIKQFVKEVEAKYQFINILINNAGVFNLTNKIIRSKTGNEVHMASNYYGPFVLTKLLVPLFKLDGHSRIVNVGTSFLMLGNINLEDLNSFKNPNFGFGNTKLYGNSKLAQGYFSYELSKKVQETNIKVYSVCPGLFKSELGNVDTCLIASLKYLIYLVLSMPVDRACESILYCVLSNEVSNETGKYYRHGRIWPKMSNAFDDDLSKSLWDQTETDLQHMNI